MDKIENGAAESTPAYDAARETFPTVLNFTESPGPENKPAGEADKKETPAFNLKEDPEFKSVSERAAAFEKEVATLRGQIQALSQRGPDRQPEKEETVDFEDLSGLTDEELRQRFDQSPSKFYGNLLRQARHEVRQDLMGEMTHRSTRERQSSGLQAFAKENSDFMEAYQSGALNDIIEGNPIHNPVSAYLSKALKTLKETTVPKADHEKAVKEAEERGRKEGEKQAHIREGARVLGRGPAANPVNYQPGTKIKSEDYGGDSTQALLARHRARRAEAGG